MYINYLKNNQIKHTVTTSEKNSRVKIISIQRPDGTHIASIKNPFYPTNSRSGCRIIRNKFNTEKHLRKFGINTPISKIYKSDQVELAEQETFKNGDYPVVIKPLDMSLGKGVMTNVSKERFKYNWELSRKSINHQNRNLMVQNYIGGFEVRATIIEGSLVSIVARVPAYVLGDGYSKIDRLIDIKNEDRMKCNYLKTMLIKKSEHVTEYLKGHGMSLDYIPRKNQYTLLTSVSNSSFGGEIIGITNLVSEEIQEIGVNALASLPGLYTGGVDIMIKSFEDKTPSILEINTFPFLMLARYTTYGPQVNPAKYYVNSIIAKDQFLHKETEKYKVENEEQYIKNYLNFMDRQVKLLNI